MTMNRHELDDLAEQARQRFADAEQEAADREIESKVRQRAKNDAIIPVRLPSDLYQAVQAAAAERHTAPSTLIRQWIAQHVNLSANGVNLADELEKLAALARAKHV